VIPHRANNCRICGSALTVHQAVKGICARAACLDRSIKIAAAKKESDRLAAMHALAKEWLADQTSRHSRYRNASLVVLPGKDSRMVPLPSAQRDTFLAHLRALTLSAAVERTGEQPPLDAPMAALASACAACRGYCCKYGGSNAFVDAQTIARVRAMHPGIENEEIAALYDAVIPERHAVDSCVFHGNSGCTLPRALRSDVCNQFYCKPLREWVATSSADDNRPTAIAVVLGTQVVRGTVVTLTDSDEGPGDAGPTQG